LKKRRRKEESNKAYSLEYTQNMGQKQCPAGTFQK
jgi:hypothetical protein